VVCVATQGRDRKVLDCFSVSIEDQEDQSFQALAERVAQTCDERKVRFAAAAVALDCGLFMQHAVHSEFTEYKKIAATVRFDTEETLTTDVADVGVAFRIIASDADGAELDVFTAERSTLSDILSSLQSQGIDPAILEPDVHCLSRYLKSYQVAPESSESGQLYALLSDTRSYLIGMPKPDEISTLRASLVGPAQERAGLLAREILVTKAAAGSRGAMDRLCVFDAAGEIAGDRLAQIAGSRVEMCDLVAMAGVEPQAVVDCANGVDFALAYGAALGLPEKEKGINFRTDHLPFQGKKRRMKNALRFFSISVAFLFLAIGVYFQTHLKQVNQWRLDLRDHFEPEYRAVMLGREELPATMKIAVGDLGRLKRRIDAETSGIGGGESTSAKLTLVLDALRGCWKQTDLNIESISITEANIVINGDTSSRVNTSRVFEALEKVFSVQNQRVDPEGNRDSFYVTVEVEKKLARD
jgi:hypothetical protein